MEVARPSMGQYTMLTEPVQAGGASVMQPGTVVQQPSYNGYAGYSGYAGMYEQPQVVQGPTVVQTAMAPMVSTAPMGSAHSVAGMEAPPPTTIVYPPVVDPNFQMPPPSPSPYFQPGYPALGITEPALPSSPGMAAVPSIGFPGGFEFRASSANPGMADPGAFQFKYQPNSQQQPPTDYGAPQSGMGMYGEQQRHDGSPSLRAPPPPAMSPQGEGNRFGGGGGLDYLEAQMRQLSEGQAILRRDLEEVKAKVARNQEHMEVLHRESGGRQQPPGVHQDSSAAAAANSPGHGHGYGGTPHSQGGSPMDTGMDFEGGGATEGSWSKGGKKLTSSQRTSKSTCF